MWRLKHSLANCCSFFQQPLQRAASDAATLVQNAVYLATQHVGAAAGAGAGRRAAPTIRTATAAVHLPALSGSLTALADPAVLALATDCLLAELLQGLQPLLMYNPAVQQWTLPDLAPLLGLLQQSCQVCTVLCGGLL